MRYNPCGKAVDWLSSCYTTKARLHADPAAPLVDIVWFFTDQDFQKHPSIINSKFWSSENARETLVGEQWPYPPWPEKPRAINEFQGDHECGEPDDFLQGQPWPYTGPLIQYDDDNIPLCCPRIRPPLVTGGSAPSADVRVIPPPFGITCCGAPVSELGVRYHVAVRGPVAVAQFFRWVLPAGEYNAVGFATNFSAAAGQVNSGPACDHMTTFHVNLTMSGTQPFSLAVDSTVCVRVGGFATEADAGYELEIDVDPFADTHRRESTVKGGGQPSAVVGNHNTDPAAGGGEAGGAAGDLHGFTDPTAGGGEAGGSAGDLQAGTDATAGGGEAGGSAGDLQAGTDPTAGGGEAGGSAGDLQAGTDAAAGGGEAGGSAGDLQAGTDAAAGGGEAGGSAGDVPSGIDAAAGGGEAGGAAGDHFNPPPPVFHSVASGSLAGGFVAPAPATNGDLLVCFVGTTGGVTQTVATGWAQVAQSPTSSGGQTLGCYTRTRTGTDPKPITGSAGTYVCYAVTGWTAVDGSGVRADVTADMNLIAPSVAITANDLEFFGFVCVDSLNTATFPGDLTVTSITFAAPHLSVGRRTSAVNPTGTETTTITAPREWATITVAVR